MARNDKCSRDWKTFSDNKSLLILFKYLIIERKKERKKMLEMFFFLI
jgi:hypothetical protein